MSQPSILNAETPGRVRAFNGSTADLDHRLDITAVSWAVAIAQCGVSYNRRRGTVRGLHFQVPPHDEVKQVRCTRGAAFDVIVDLRPESSTFKRWASVELSADNHAVVYVPRGFAHGFQTLVDDTELFYQIDPLRRGGGPRHPLG